MASPRVHVHLFVASGVLCALYVTLGLGVAQWQRAHSQPERAPSAATSDASAAFYRVTGADGSVHVLQVSDVDPSSVLTETARFGPAATVQLRSGSVPTSALAAHGPASL
ncbi:MAG TPA: hypothetical protein VF331_09535 [Polyangiales bacterium]